MAILKADIIAGLQKDILKLQGFTVKPTDNKINVGLGPVENAFPYGRFPLGAIHEFISTSAEDSTATCGFIAGILSSLMRVRGACLWIGSSPTIFPAALHSFGIEPHKIIFINLSKEKEVLWTLEEALKCEGLSAVVGELKDISFTASRRLQLAVEHSRVTGFILRQKQRLHSTTAAVASWKISSLPSLLTGELPGVGFPRWNVELLKVRNGKKGSWQMEWVGGKFRPAYPLASVIHVPHKKTG